ncbi:hypothetical protein B0H13DRAFT_2273678 [Mycena leptocephala]|nr:hypothetical protein B0H13DRAFT_2273678 [Mycena leptocephala]
MHLALAELEQPSCATEATAYEIVRSLQLNADNHETPRELPRTSDQNRPHRQKKKLCETGTLEQIDFPKSMKPKKEKNGWKPNRDPTSKRIRNTTRERNEEIELERKNERTREAPGNELHLHYKKGCAEKTNIKGKRGPGQASAPRVWRVEHRAAKARPRARVGHGTGTISREVGWDTYRISETSAGATKRDGATVADGVREEPSAGCEIDTVVGRQKGYGAEREVCGGRSAVVELGPAPEGGALASAVEWWRIGGARKDNSSEPGLGGSACNWKAITRKGLESVMWRQQDQGE